MESNDLGALFGFAFAFFTVSYHLRDRLLRDALSVAALGEPPLTDGDYRPARAYSIYIDPAMSRVKPAE